MRTLSLFPLLTAVCLGLLAASGAWAAPASLPRQDCRLDEGWKTLLGDPDGAQAVGFQDAAWKIVSVPHNWEDYQGYHGKMHGNLHGVAWYRRTFALPASMRSQRVFLQFEGVGSYAQVWINGRNAGGHKGGRTTFELDITGLVAFGQTNLVAVRADHPEKIADLPYVCGGCYGSPNTEGSQPIGIFRPVHLVLTAPVRIEPFGVHVWTPEISEQKAVVRIQSELKNYGPASQTVTLRSEIVDASGKTLDRVEKSAEIQSGKTAVFDQTTPALEHPHLWSLDDPYLHYVRTTVLLNGQAVDSVSTRFGLRWIEWPVGSIGDNALPERPIDPARLKETPSAANNYFTTRTGGLRDSQIHVQPAGVQVFIPSCSADSAVLRIKTTIKNSDAVAHPVRVTSFIRNEAQTKFVYSLENDRELAPGETFTFDQTSPAINFPELWSPENPLLHVVETTVQDPAHAGGKNSILYDRTETSFGILATTGLANKGSAYAPIKTTNATAAAAAKPFLLNGKPVFLNGIAEYEHLLGDDHAFSDEQIRARLHQIKAAGFNALREGHHPHNLRYVELCDELGILDWTQIGAHIYFDNEEFRNNYRQAVREWVRERRNSPSIVLWGLQNESRLPMVFARELTEIIRKLDPTTSSQRKTTTCNGGTGSDWNVPQNWFGTYGGNVNNYGPALVQQQLVGEYGQYRTLGLHQDGNWQQNWGAKQNIGREIPEELFTYCLETKVRLAEENKTRCCGQFLWIFSTHANPGRSETDCRDGLGLNAIGVVNYKGLLTCWGEPVDAYYMYRANYAPADRQPMVYLDSHTWPDRFDSPGVKSNLVAFSNCEEVELYNDYKTASLGVCKRGAIGTHFQWNNANLRYNVLYAEGRIHGKTVASDLIVLKNLPPAPAWQAEKARQPDNTAPAAGARYLYRINCGGGNYTDSHGQLWEADAHWSSWAQDYPELDPRFGSVRRTEDPIAGTRDDDLFRTYRYGRQKLNYTLPLPNGSYTAELYFIEPWYGVGGGLDCTGWRLFDVAFNGQVVLHDLDIWKETATASTSGWLSLLSRNHLLPSWTGPGHARALKKVIPVTVTNGVLEIGFPNVKSYQAVISAIAVRSDKP